MTLVYDCTIKHPARILIFGPTFSGKSTLVSKLLSNQKQVFDLNFDRIIYCSDGSMLRTESQVENIETYEYFDKELFDELDPKQKNCLIIDDFMHKAANDILISELFTKRSHHQNVIRNDYPVDAKYLSKIQIYDRYQKKCQLYISHVESSG